MAGTFITDGAITPAKTNIAAISSSNGKVLALNSTYVADLNGGSLTNVSSLTADAVKGFNIAANSVDDTKISGVNGSKLSGKISVTDAIDNDATIVGITTATSGWGVRGYATASSGYTYGGRFEAVSPNGISLAGMSVTAKEAIRADQSNSGVAVTALSAIHSGTTGMAVYGSTYNPSGTETYGGKFLSTGTSGYGVYGENTAASGTTYGVYGKTNSASGYGLYGTDGTRYGYLGTANYGAYGYYSATQFGYLGGASYGAYGRGASAGVYGTDGTRYGYLGGASYGAYGDNGTVYGYLASASYGALGYYDSTHYGYLGGSVDGAYGRSSATSYGVLGSLRTIGGDAKYVGVYAANSNATAGDEGPALFAEATGVNNANCTGVWGYSQYSYGVRGETGTASSYGLYTDGQSYVGNRIDNVYAYNNAVTGIALYVDSNGLYGKSSSSRRYKHDIRDYDLQINKVSELKPVKFKWNEGLADANKEDFGLIAEDVYKVFPELVFLNEKGEPDGVRYEKISVILLKAYQEKQKEVEELKTRLNALEAKMTTVLEKIETKPSADKGTPISMVNP